MRPVVRKGVYYSEIRAALNRNHNNSDDSEYVPEAVDTDLSEDKGDKIVNILLIKT